MNIGGKLCCAMPRTPADLPPPLWGRVRGGGIRRTSSRSGIPPTPNPSPQGGGEPVAARGARHEHRRQALSHHLARRRTAWSVEIIDQTQAAARARHRHAEDARGCRPGDQDHAGARRAADRRHRRLRRLPGAARRTPPTRASTAPSPISPSSAPPPSTCAGRSRRCAPRCATSRARPASPPPTRAPPRWPRPTSRPTAPSAGTAPS